MEFDEACHAAKLESIKHNCSQHVNKSNGGDWYVSDWYDVDSTCATYESGIKIF